MKTKLRFLSIAMMLMLSIGLLAGCGSSDSTDSTDSSGSTDSTDSSDSTDDSDSTYSSGSSDEEDVIGEVTYISTLSISLDVYEADSVVEDYAALDTSTLTATGSSDTVTLESDVEYYYISDGALVSATSEDIVEGDMIAITTDDSGVQQVILLMQNDSSDTDV